MVGKGDGEREWMKSKDEGEDFGLWTLEGEETQLCTQPPTIYIIISYYCHYGLVGQKKNKIIIKRTMTCYFVAISLSRTHSDTVIHTYPLPDCQSPNPPKQIHLIASHLISYPSHLISYPKNKKGFDLAAYPTRAIPSTTQLI